MNTAQKIECINNTHLVVSFTVSNGQYTTASSGHFCDTSTIDLAASSLPEGDIIRPEVSVLLFGKVKTEDQVQFEMNGKTAQYEIARNGLGLIAKLIQITDGPGIRPAGFPPDIPVDQVPFVNWNRTIDVSRMWTCAPRTAEDVVTVCNWAATNRYTIRPRGIMHNWSPLSVAPGLPSYSNILVVDTTKALNGMTFIPADEGSYGCATVKVGVGATMDKLLTFLEQQPGGKGAAPGYSFPHIPAPAHLTVGGVVAINGHGAAVPTPPNDSFPVTYGSMSNRILSLTAVVTDPVGTHPDSYQLKKFDRGDSETTAFLTQLGRAMIVDVTFQVIDNYNLRCLSITNLDKDTLFKAPEADSIPVNSCGDFLNRNGRIEVIWYPFSTYPWLKVWSVTPEKPDSSIQVIEPNNYPFSDNLPDDITEIIRLIAGVPHTTAFLGKGMEIVTDFGLDGKDFLGISGKYPVSRDIWGASKNTLFYIKDTTLRVNANGYAVITNKSNVQQAIARFTAQFQAMLENYQSAGKYPVNAPLEIRVTGLDSSNDVTLPTGNPAGRPIISSIATDIETEKNNWDVAVWFDVLTIPNTPHENEFYTELESWLLGQFMPPFARVVPEWSKGWAYTVADGAWTNGNIIEYIKAAFTSGRDSNDNWGYENKILSKYDASGIYQSPILQSLFNNQ